MQKLRYTWRLWVQLQKKEATDRLPNAFYHRPPLDLFKFPFLGLFYSIRLRHAFIPSFVTLAISLLSPWVLKDLRIRQGHASLWYGRRKRRVIWQIICRFGQVFSCLTVVFLNFNQRHSAYRREEGDKDAQFLLCFLPLLICHNH